VQIVALSRFLSRMAGQTMTYGIMVFLAVEGSGQLKITVANSAGYLAALLVGLQGGMLADSRPKRQVLAVSFAALAAVCILGPILLGTSGLDLLAIIFIASGINQVVGPGMKSVVAIVATPEEVATAASLINIVGSIGSSVGSMLIAPVLIKQFGIDAVLIASGLLYLLSAIRIYRLPAAEEIGMEELRQPLRDLDWKPRALSLRYNADWAIANRPVASMLLVGALSAALLHGVTTLVPIFVRDVLKADPTNSVYIFFLSGVGFFVGAFIAPSLLARYGERQVAIGSFLLMAVSVILLGFVDAVATPFAFISPLRLLSLFNVDLSKPILAAGVIAFPANLGSTICLQSVQVYVNKNVPKRQQGGIFGLQQVQENALNLMAIVSLGLLSVAVGPQYIFIFAPIVVGLIGLALITYTFRQNTGEMPHLSQGFEFLLEDDPPKENPEIDSSSGTGTTDPKQ
jgi:MFS family permease